jgi:hypothetical protein
VSKSPLECLEHHAKAEKAFVDRYEHPIAKRVAREVYRSRQGMQAGMPKVQLDSNDVEALLSRWKMAGDQP